MSILAHSEIPCRQCGQGKNLDHEKTAQKAIVFMGALEKKAVAEKMNISPQYLGDMLATPPRRKWNAELAEKFEAAVNGLKA